MPHGARYGPASARVFYVKMRSGGGCGEPEHGRVACAAAHPACERLTTALIQRASHPTSTRARVAVPRHSYLHTAFWRPTKMGLRRHVAVGVDVQLRDPTSPWAPN